MTDIRIKIIMFMVDWISTEDRDNGRVMWKQQWLMGLHEVQGIYWRDEERLALQEIHAVNQLLGSIKTEDRRCANVARTTIQDTAALSRNSTWGPNAHEQPVQPIDAAWPESSAATYLCSFLPSFLCFSINSLPLQSMSILTSSHGTDRTAKVIHVGLRITEWR